MDLLISEVVDEIINEVGNDTDDSTLVTKMFGFFKAGMREVPTFARQRLVITDETMSLAASAQTLDLTGLTYGFSKETNVWRQGTNGARIPIYRPPSRSYFHRLYQTGYPGKPSYYIISGKTMRFDKKADEALTIGIEYFKEISDIETTDTFFGDESLLQACKWLCKEVYYRGYEEDKAKADDARINADRIIFELECDFEAQELGLSIASNSN